MTTATQSNRALIQQATRALAREGISLADVLTTMYGERAPETVTRKAAARKIGGSVTPSEEETTALDIVLNRLAEIDVPEHPRELSLAEKRRTTEAMVAVKKVKSFADRAEKKLVEISHGHFDVHAEVANLADGTTPINDHGYYIVEDKDSLAVPGLDEKITRTKSKGGISVTAQGLQLLESQGKISHAAYLGMTEEAGRTVNERKMLDYLSKHPELMPAIKTVIEKSGGNVSIRMSPNK